MRTKIKQIGYEIEGEWGTKAYILFNDLGTMKGDGSLRGCASGTHKKPLSLSEFNSEPVDIRDVEEETKQQFKELQEYYEDNEFHFNTSCGFHIHYSFFPKFPPEILSEQFSSFFYKRMEKELAGVLKKRETNSYCRFEHCESDEKIEKLIRGQGQSRYGAINFDALRRHGTVEFRIFPTTKPKTMYSFIEFTTQAIQDYIASEPKFHLEASLDGEQTVFILPKCSMDINHEQEEIHETANLLSEDLSWI